MKIKTVVAALDPYLFLTNISKHSFSPYHRGLKSEKKCKLGKL